MDRDNSGLNFEPFELTLEYARHLDQQDELASFRDQFVVTDPELIYMDGNSLGRLPRRTVELTQTVVYQQWGERLIRSWGENWFISPQRSGEKLARLVGAQPGQVIVADSVSVNLYKLAMAALQMRSDRRRIISDTLNFPSDLYILQGCMQTIGRGYALHLVPSQDGVMVEPEAVIRAIDDETALVTLSQVVFKSGYLYDVATITRAAHERGALVLWDLSHSVGVVPICLDEWGVDFAVGCTYKYLNGGPGAPAFLYVNRSIQAGAISPIWGWFGEKAPFEFGLEYQPAEGIRRFLCGTPPILSLLAMEPGLDLTLEAGVDRIRNKSIRQTAYLTNLYDTYLAPLGFELGTPRSPELRGSHISLRHPQGYQINRCLIEEMKVIPDFREPDHIRLGIAPLYTRFEDIWTMVQRVWRAVQEGRYRKYAGERSAVT